MKDTINFKIDKEKIHLNFKRKINFNPVRFTDLISGLTSRGQKVNNSKDGL